MKIYLLHNSPENHLSASAFKLRNQITYEHLGNGLIALDTDYNSPIYLRNCKSLKLKEEILTDATDSRAASRLGEDKSNEQGLWAVFGGWASYVR